MTDPLYPLTELGVPYLDLRTAATSLPLPVLGWGSTRRRGDMPEGGTWHCYVDDARFRRLWDHPDDVALSPARVVVEPNFSVFDETPYPVALWGIYRKRWLARYWGSLGLAVVVDLNVSARYRGLALEGVPHGWPCYCTRGYADRLDDLDAEYALACARAGGRPELFVVYAGGGAVESLCAERGWTYLDDQTRAARAREVHPREAELRRGYVDDGTEGLGGEG